jgi:hypothetical protein
LCFVEQVNFHEDQPGETARDFFATILAGFTKLTKVLIVKRTYVGDRKPRRSENYRDAKKLHPKRLIGKLLLVAGDMLKIIHANRISLFRRRGVQIDRWNLAFKGCFIRGRLALL